MSKLGRPIRSSAVAPVSRFRLYLQRNIKMRVENRSRGDEPTKIRALPRAVLDAMVRPTAKRNTPPLANGFRVNSLQRSAKKYLSALPMISRGIAFGSSVDPPPWRSAKEFLGPVITPIRLFYYAAASIAEGLVRSVRLTEPRHAVAGNHPFLMSAVSDGVKGSATPPDSAIKTVTPNATGIDGLSPADKRTLSNLLDHLVHTNFGGSADARKWLSSYVKKLFHHFAPEGLGKYIQAAAIIIDLDFHKRIYPADEVVVRDGLFFLISILRNREMMDRLLPGSWTFYAKRSKLYYEDGMPDITFGYHYYEHPSNPRAIGSPNFHRVVDIKPGHITLDPQTGSGTAMLALAIVYPQSRFIAMDINPESLQELNKRAFELRELNLSIVPQDITHGIPLGDNSVDRIMLNNWSTFGFSERVITTYFREILRVVRDGGIVWMDYGIHKTQGATADAKEIENMLLHAMATEMDIALKNRLNVPGLRIETPNGNNEVVHAFAYEVRKDPTYE